MNCSGETLKAIFIARDDNPNDGPIHFIKEK